MQILTVLLEPQWSDSAEGRVSHNICIEINGPLCCYCALTHMDSGPAADFGLWTLFTVEKQRSR